MSIEEKPFLKIDPITGMFLINFISEIKDFLVKRKVVEAAFQLGQLSTLIHKNLDFIDKEE